METSFKTCMFGGFDREDVISFIQKTAEENQTRLDALTAENRTQPPHRRPTYIIKDVRLFLNSVERGVRLMQSAGVGAEVGRRDTEEEILLTIHIPKRRPAAVVTES